LLYIKNTKFKFKTSNFDQIVIDVRLHEQVDALTAGEPGPN